MRATGVTVGGGGYFLSWSEIAEMQQKQSRVDTVIVAHISSLITRHCIYRKH